MYIINRRKGEQIKIGDTVITIISNQRVKLGVQAAKDVRVEIVKEPKHVSLSDSAVCTTAQGTSELTEASV